MRGGRFTVATATVLLRSAIVAIAAGRAPVQLVVNIDLKLERGSDVFEIRRPETFWHEDAMNVTFGPYRVTHMDIGWIPTSSEHKE